MEHSKAKHLQAALRAYKAAMLRLENAAEPNEVASAADDYLVTKQRFKRAVLIGEGKAELVLGENSEQFTEEQRALLAKAKGEGGYNFRERVDAYLEFEPDATASDVAGATAISLQEVLGIFEQRKAEAGA
jgi:hypothetical protein